MVTAATWESAKVRGIRALNVALDSIKQEIIHAKFTVKVQKKKTLMSDVKVIYFSYQNSVVIKKLNNT